MGQSRGTQQLIKVGFSAAGSSTSILIIIIIHYH